MILERLNLARKRTMKILKFLKNVSMLCCIVSNTSTVFFFCYTHIKQCQNLLNAMYAIYFRVQIVWVCCTRCFLFCFVVVVFFLTNMQYEERVCFSGYSLGYWTIMYHTKSDCILKTEQANQWSRTLWS